MRKSMPQALWRSKATYPHPRQGGGVYRVILLRNSFYILAGDDDGNAYSCPQEWAKSIHQNEDQWLEEIQAGRKLEDWSVAVDPEGKLHLSPIKRRLG